MTKQKLTPDKRKEALLDFSLEVKARQSKPIPEEELEPIRQMKRVRAKVGRSLR